MANAFEEILKGLGRGVGTVVSGTRFGQNIERNKQQRFANDMAVFQSIKNPKGKAKALAAIMQSYPEQLKAQFEVRKRDFMSDTDRRARRQDKAITDEDVRQKYVDPSGYRSLASKKSASDVDPDVAAAEGFAKILDAEVAAGYKPSSENAAFFEERKNNYMDRVKESRRKKPRRVEPPPGSFIKDNTLYFDGVDYDKNLGKSGARSGGIKSNNVDNATGLTSLPAEDNNKSFFGNLVDDLNPFQAATPQSPGEKQPKTFVDMGPEMQTPDSQQSLVELEAMMGSGMDVREDYVKDPTFYAKLFKAIRNGVPDGKGGTRKLSKKEILEIIQMGR